MNKPKTKAITLRISTEELQAIDKIAESCEVQRSKVIRMAIRSGLKSCKGLAWYQFYD